MRAVLLVTLFVVLALCDQRVRGAVPKPIWPTQFDVTFGLSVEPDIAPNSPAIVNATAHFYYNWDLNSTLITYSESCIPGLLPINKNFACDLIFNNVGCYILAPTAGVDCCLLLPGIGSVPPDFLTPFNYTGLSFPAADLNGVLHPVYFWQADLVLSIYRTAFFYWTDVKSQQDIQFVDGGVVMWNFAPTFNVVSQPASLFTVPSTCAKSCPTSPVHRRVGLSRLMKR